MNSGLNKVLSVIVKIMEIGYWIMSAFTIISAILSLASNEFVQALSNANTSIDMNCYGFAVTDLATAGDNLGICMALTFFGAGLISVILALIHRNINTIFRTVQGKNKKTENTSPFQKLVVDSVKRIGMLSIAIPAVGFVVTIVMFVVSLVLGNPVSVTLSLSSVVVGLICLSLSQIFAYGAKLEDEVDGLL